MEYRVVLVYGCYSRYVDISVNKKELTIGDLIGDIDGELQIRLVPVCPVVGWMLGAYINRRPLKSPKKLKRAAKKKSE
ncbi:hypothetical protein ANCDUO_18862 [Ancylostoma duodenale]|uniref:Uncharacterized protein n=1 Tax=Ancylostoma duodenale TaxID=51022 RepID=A0A0C2FR52_9BILA|nr:hypothetical protein ANCDUO_18862 [Ancylostoma duodenale]